MQYILHSKQYTSITFPAQLMRMFTSLNLCVCINVLHVSPAVSSSIRLSDESVYNRLQVFMHTETINILHSKQQYYSFLK